MNDVNLSISKEIVEPIIEAKINTAVCEALSGSENIVSDVVTKILNEKVDRDGKRSSYGNDIPFIKWLCENAIKESATQAIKNYIDSSNEKLIEAIQKVLQRNTKSIAVNLVKSFIEATKNDWSMKVDLSVNNKKDNCY